MVRQPRNLPPCLPVVRTHSWPPFRREAALPCLRVIDTWPTGLVAGPLSLTGGDRRRYPISQHLVVAHQTATSPELLQRLSELAADDSQADFTLLVPATPVAHFLVGEEAETQAVAQNRIREAKALFESSGLSIVRTAVSDG